jgi:hypothetical protein
MGDVRLWWACFGAMSHDCALLRLLPWALRGEDPSSRVHLTPAVMQHACACTLSPGSTGPMGAPVLALSTQCLLSPPIAIAAASAGLLQAA